MKKIIMLFLVFISLEMNAQVNQSKLVGEWIEVGSEMKDGSTKLTPYKSNVFHYKFVFKKNSLQITPLYLYDTNPDYVFYTIKDFTIITPEMDYDIQELTDKTLVLTENNPEIEDYKLKRYFLVRKELLDQRKKAENTDSILIASEYFTPKITKYSEKPDLYKKISKEAYRTSGLMVLDLKTERSDVFIDNISLEKSKNIAKEIALLEEIIREPYFLWDIKGFEEYSKIEIPFVLDNRKTEKGYELSFSYFTQDVSIFDNNYYEPSPKDREASYNLYQKGVELFNKKKPTEAIKFFTDAYALDAENIDALYNKAVMYYDMKDMKNACLIWNELKNLGQIRATKLAEEYCK